LVDPRAGVVAAEEAAPVAAAAARLLFVENIRWAMIVLVLSMHAADTYSPFGSWYYQERPPIGEASTLFFLTYQGFLQGFFMALLFFIAGCFTPKSYDAKGARGFVAGRLFRLGLPTLLYVVAIGPITEYFIARSWRTRATFPSELAHYFLSGGFLSGTGPMWFCAALLIFTGGYVAWRRWAPARRPRALTPTASAAALTVAALTISTFVVRLSQPLGSSVLNLQLCYFPSYVIMFALGIAASRGRWLETVSDRFAWTTAFACLGLAAPLWPALLVAGVALTGHRDAYVGGLTWQSAGLCLWEALICVGMCAAVLAGFRAWRAGQGRFSRVMSDNAFAVYVLHPPVLIGLALALRPLPLSPIPKFALLWAVSALVCFGLVAPLARKAPGLRRILS
jgi:hypothetical protein